MNKKMVKLMIMIAAVIVTAVTAVMGVCCFRKGYITVKKETELYSVSIPIQWNVNNIFDDYTNFTIGSDRVASIETFCDSSYCTSAESIAVNTFGMHSSLESLEETVLGEWTRYKMVIAYEASAAEQEGGEAGANSETHYIYTNKKDKLVDIYVNEQSLTEEVVQRFIDSFKMK